MYSEYFFLHNNAPRIKPWRPGGVLRLRLILRPLKLKGKETICYGRTLAVGKLMINQSFRHVNWAWQIAATPGSPLLPN